MSRRQPRVVFSVAEAAEYAGVHPETMRRLLVRGDIPARKLGREWRVHRDSIDEYLRPTWRVIYGRQAS